MRDAGRGVVLLVLLAVAALFAGCSNPLATAAMKGDVRTMEALLAAGADVNAEGFDGYMALDYAATKGDMQAARLLIEKGADLGARTYRGNAALQVAAAAGHVEIVRLFIEYGADVNEKVRREYRLASGGVQRTRGRCPSSYSRRRGDRDKGLSRQDPSELCRGEGPCRRRPHH